MSCVVGLSGWALALLSLGLAAFSRARLERHLEALARGCHELRGPLTALRLGLEAAPRMRQLPQIRQLPQSRLRALELELGRATLALDDLSMPAGRRPGRRAVAGAHATFARDSVDLAELLADSVEAWRAPAATQGVSLTLIAPTAGCRVQGQRLRLAQAVDNLIANAIEHGGGAVEVSVRSGVDTLRIDVVDSGPGLPASIDQLRRERRGRGWRERGHGLAVVGEVAAAHGGRLATRPSERGAHVVLELPSPRAAAAAQHRVGVT